MSQNQHPHRRKNLSNRQQNDAFPPHAGQSGQHGRRSTPLPSESSSDELLRNVPPHSVEAEQAVLGGVFLRPESLYSVIDTLAEDDFYVPAHRIIYGAFRTLFQQNAPIDLLSIAEHLKAHALLEDCGGAVYLAELAKNTLSSANIEYYATLVRDKALTRNLIGSCAEIISQGFDASLDVRTLLDSTEQTIFNISQRSTNKTYKDSGELTRKVFSDLRARMERKETLTGVSTGYARLDDMTAGLQNSDLIILAARPSMGKTAFALNIAMNAAVRNNLPTVIYSLEMSMDQLLMRMLCAWGKVDLSILRRNRLSDDDWQALHEAAPFFEQAPLYIDDTPSLSPLEVRARTRRLKMEKGVGLVIIDYLQLMRSSRKTDSRELEISDISRNLKAMAKELNVPVIALSQLNRKVEERKDKTPMLSDLRESGAIEQDADVIMFIHRPATALKPDERPRVEEAEIIIGKQRNGPVGLVRLVYASAFTVFEDPTTPYDPATGL